MPNPPVVRIGIVPVGDGHPVVFLAEIGTFFNQSRDLARLYLRKIADAGASVFKTEILHDPNVCLPATGLAHEYVYAGGKTVEDYRSLIERKCNPLSFYEELVRECRTLGMQFVASVYDFQGADFVAATGGAAIKIARNNIDNIPLIRYCATKKLPLIFDFGNLYLWELARALDEARRAGAPGIIVNHHPGLNPAPPNKQNLAAIVGLKTEFSVPVGLSCHYRGEEILYAAIGAGVNLIEKGIDQNPDRMEQDLVSASKLDDLPTILARVRACSDAIGHFPVEPTEPRDLSIRAGLAAARPIAVGELLTLENVRFSWPPIGISAAEWDRADGKPARRMLMPLDPITWEDIAS